MFPSNRFPFGLPGDTDAGEKLFQNAHTLNLSINRGSKLGGGESDIHKPFIFFELSGGFETKDGDLMHIAAELMQAFKQLPPIDRSGTCSDDDDGGNDDDCNN